MSATNIKFFYDNKWWDTANTLTASSADTSFPVTNTQERQRTTRWHATGDTAEWIQIAGTAIVADGIFIFGHNLTSGATVTVQGDDAAAWGAPDFSQAMTRTSIARMNQYVALFSAQKTYNYWRITIADAANPDTYVALGTVWLGAMGLEPANGMSSAAIPIPISNSIINISASGQATGLRRPMLRGLNIPFQMITERPAVELLLFDRDIVGPFVLVHKPFDNETSYATPEDYSHYVRLNDTGQFSGIRQEKWGYTMSVIEEG